MMPNFAFEGDALRQCTVCRCVRALRGSTRCWAAPSLVILNGG